ncbi:c-type cytochrome, methanol metabolism-related [Phyllobacterium sp. 21LDTY02-6]|uniref:c-type cytochrome, methanol metabolism-related n=1 Tax=unclassified Phyllobacterium TaxID=2638441 RepID=UPI002020637D|nr:MULTISPECIES: c-type cytochrome, methanol metabolism-related [unclassified Phyllobacterium]MCO4318182.1 c-type cytochrome, methanol metabolism-related [Phyllobacterium sp. 21LDTY02-6]MCX8280177.1 c-type cytochrome, methanol metabolism-related [Phyllobacterium sp. 0TCS1.6C]MCX8294262.1 c-type cytochrome, methanol metabolism-related [Phyllobacterium sp. 0TCS1.6A]
MLATQGSVLADDKEAAAAVSEDNGKHADKEGNPTFKIDGDGSVDWYTYSGYRRFNSECNVCHGADGAGSSFAPALAESLKNMPYADFMSIVAGGRKNLSSGNEKVMPAFGDNKNVYCYMDDLYVYLRARAVGDLPRGRPAKHADKPEAAKEAEKSCMGG